MPLLGLAKGLTIKKLPEKFKIAGAHQGIAENMIAGQFHLLHALRMQPRFQECDCSSSAHHQEIAAKLRAVHAVEEDVPGAVDYLQAPAAGKFGAAAQ